MKFEKEYWDELGNLFRRKAINRKTSQNKLETIYSLHSTNKIDINNISVEDLIALLELILEGKITETSTIIEAAKRFSDDIDIQYLIAAILFMKGKNEIALSSINKLLGQLENIEALNLKAMILWKNRQIGELEYILNKALLLDPDNIEILFNKGLFSLEIEDYVNAANSFKRILEINPDHAPTLLRMANVIMQSQRVDNVNYDAAIKLLKRALDLSPDIPEILETLGIALFNLGNITEAEKYFQKLIKTQKEEAAWYYLGLAAFSRGNTEQAMALFSQALKINPTNPDLWYYHGLAAMYSNKPEEAKSSLQKAIDLDPSLIEARDFLKML